MSDLKETVRSLQLEYWYIHLVYHRNRNQHRKTRWWCQFNIFKRSINRILEHINGNVHNNNKKNKKKNNNDTNLQDIVAGRYCQNLVRKFLKFQLPSIYREFQNVLTMGQFVTLAVVLIGLLAKCRSLLLKLRSESEQDGTRSTPTVEESARQEYDKLLLDNSVVMQQHLGSTEVDEDLGMEIVEDTSIETKTVDKNTPTIDLVNKMNETEKRDKKKKKSKKKSKKKRSVIDDIFG